MLSSLRPGIDRDVAALRVGEQVEVTPALTVRKLARDRYVLRHRHDRRNRFGTREEIVADVLHAMEHGELREPNERES